MNNIDYIVLTGGTALANIATSAGGIAFQKTPNYTDTNLFPTGTP